MNIHEYQAKEILARHKVPVPKGKIAFTPQEAEEVAKEFLASPNGVSVVKAQIHAGGRGKAGGVKLARTREEALSHAKDIIGKVLITHQTGPAGKEVKKVLVEEGCNIGKELYVGLVVDRSRQRVAVMACEEGGVEIEEIAARSPEKIIKEFIDPAVGLQGFQARKLAFALNLDKTLINKAVGFFTGLYNAFVSSDCSMLEINPLVITKDGNLVALDAKISLDDNGLFRHKDIEAMRDLDEEDPNEVEAS
ncbi:MAG: ATP-grasp domain-containing protein, partial [Deltaproteobacteria bacterium]